MELSTFYAVLSGTCLALVGLWWSALDRRPALLASPAARRASGGVLLTFLLPGGMGLFAQVDPSQPWVWRSTFVILAAIGVVSTWQLIRLDTTSRVGPLRWLAAASYAVVLVIAVAPVVADWSGLAGRQAAGLVLVLLVLVAHALAWDVLTGHQTATPPAGEPE